MESLHKRSRSRNTTQANTIVMLATTVSHTIVKKQGPIVVKSLKTVAYTKFEVELSRKYPTKWYPKLFRY